MEHVKTMTTGCPDRAFCCIFGTWITFSLSFGVAFLIFFFVLGNAENDSKDCEIRPFLWL